MNRTIVLAGGCFWGMEELFRELPGVCTTEVGYAGGELSNPTYEYHPGHAEALRITYNSSRISYKELLDFFFRIHNPTTLNQQGNDVGEAYRSAIFYTNKEEVREAKTFIERINSSQIWQDPVVTTLEPLTTFWSAEEEHQKYLQKHPGGYTCHTIHTDSYL